MVISYKDKLRILASKVRKEEPMTNKEYITYLKLCEWNRTEMDRS